MFVIYEIDENKVRELFKNDELATLKVCNGVVKLDSNRSISKQERAIKYFIKD